MSVTLSEVQRAARAHRAPLAGESAGYLVLAIADQVLQAPRLVRPAEIQLTEDGAVCVSAGKASSDVEAELALRSALDQLLLVASSGSAALTRASRRTVPLGLSALVRELEADGIQAGGASGDIHFKSGTFAVLGPNDHGGLARGFAVDQDFVRVDGDRLR